MQGRSLDRNLPGAGARVGRELPLMRHVPGLDQRSGFEEATRRWRFAAEFELGKVSAAHLGEIMERKLNFLVLMVETNRGIPGQPAGRRNWMRC